MPLTSAERSRRYREKLKRENPEKLEAQRLKNLKRIKAKKLKISQMTPEAAEKKREAWRKEKRSSRQKKKAAGQVTSQKTVDIEAQSSSGDVIYLDTKVITKLCKKNKSLSNKCRRFKGNNGKLKKLNEKIKKRCQRTENTMTNEINNLKTELMKAKARAEILENTLHKTYQNCSQQSEKRTLKKLVVNSENRKIVHKMLGLNGKLRIQQKKKIRNKISLDEITKFYLRDDVSRNTSGKKETRTKTKNKQQIRYLCDTLQNTFDKYKKEGGKYGFITFYKFKPFFVLSPGMSSRDTCLCPKHSNIDFLHNALLKHKIISGSRKQAVENVCCNTENYKCMYNLCINCKDKKIQFNSVTEEQLNKQVQWLQWARQDHIYEKKTENTKKEVKTIRTEKVIKKGTIDDLKKNYEKQLILFKKHHYNNIKQQNEYQKAVSEVRENECLIVCDFSESYEAKLANEVQSMHFGASKRQISLHTGMIFWKNKAQSFCTMSDETSHQPPAIWAHLAPIIQMIKEQTPNVEILHFYTDGPSSQYRQKTNFYLLAYFTHIHNFRYATWSFYEAHHGKSVADGIGGSIKRNLDKKVCLGVDVVDAKDALKVSKDSLKKTKVFLILKSDIDNISKIIPDKLPVLKGTMQLHQIVTNENDKMKISFRDISCFCGDLRGQCDCFSPKSHSVVLPNSLMDNPSISRDTRTIKETSDKIVTAYKKDATEKVYTANLKDTTNKIFTADLNDTLINIDTADLNNTPNHIDTADLNNTPNHIDTADQNDTTDIAKTKESSNGIYTSDNKDTRDKNTAIQIKVIDPCKNKNRSPHRYMPSDFTCYEPQTKIPKIETSNQNKKSETTPTVNIISDITIPAMTESNYYLPKDLEDCIVQPITCANDIIIEPHKFAAKYIKPHEKSTEFDYYPFIENCKPKIDLNKSGGGAKVKILDIKTFVPKPHNAANPLILTTNNSITRSTKRKISTTIIYKTDCKKCLFSISGSKHKCMVCKNFYCNQCVGQQTFPDSYICDACLEE